MVTPMYLNRELEFSECSDFFFDEYSKKVNEIKAFEATVPNFDELDAEDERVETLSSLYNARDCHLYASFIFEVLSIEAYFNNCIAARISPVRFEELDKCSRRKGFLYKIETSVREITGKNLPPSLLSRVQQMIEARNFLTHSKPIEVSFKADLFKKAARDYFYTKDDDTDIYDVMRNTHGIYMELIQEVEMLTEKEVE